MNRVRPIALAAVVVCLLSTGALAGSLKVSSPGVISGPSPFTAERCGEGASPSERESVVSIAVNPADRTHVVAAWDQDELAGIVVATSHDGGGTWSTAVPADLETCAPDATEHATEPNLAITPSGVAYIAAFVRDDRTTAIGRTLVSRSADGGSTWSPAARPDLEVQTVGSDLDDIAAEPDQPDAVDVVWSPVEAVAEQTIMSRTTDGGVTWTPHLVRIAPPGTAAWNRLIALGDGSLVLVFQDAAFADLFSPVPLVGRIGSVRSSDKGVNWSPLVTIGEGAALQWPGVAADAVGNVYASWITSTPGGTCRRGLPPFTAQGGDCRAVVARSADGGATWNDPVAVFDWSGGWMPTPGLAVASDGTVGLVQTLPSADGGEVWLAHSHDNGASWESTRLAGPFALPANPGEADGFGLFQELGGGNSRFVAAFVQGSPAAVVGPTDVFGVTGKSRKRAGQ